MTRDYNGGRRGFGYPILCLSGCPHIPFSPVPFIDLSSPFYVICSHMELSFPVFPLNCPHFPLSQIPFFILFHFESRDHLPSPFSRFFSSGLSPFVGQACLAGLASSLSPLSSLSFVRKTHLVQLQSTTQFSCLPGIEPKGHLEVKPKGKTLGNLTQCGKDIGPVPPLPFAFPPVAFPPPLSHLLVDLCPLLTLLRPWARSCKVFYSTRQFFQTLRISHKTPEPSTWQRSESTDSAASVVWC